MHISITRLQFILGETYDMIFLVISLSYHRIILMSSPKKDLD